MPWTNENYSIGIQPESQEHCSAQLGFMSRRKVPLNILPDCGFGVIVHELMHTLGTLI